MEEDCMSSDNDYYYADEEDDRDSLSGLQGVENDLTSRNDRGSSTKVITRESLLAAQKEDLRRIMDWLSLKEHHARTILIHYRWDVEKVLAVLVEKGKDRLFAEAGIIVLENPDPCSSSSSFDCSICMEEKSAHEVAMMDCGHYFCNDCCFTPKLPPFPPHSDRIDAVLDDEFVSTTSGGFRRFLVQWEGRPAHDSTWITEEELQACTPDLLEAYLSTLSESSSFLVGENDKDTFTGQKYYHRWFRKFRNLFLF
ncbi:hypothetical protein Ancab_028923 [Ancistrocladus abbreviatus]